MKRQILPDHISVNHALLVLMVLLQLYISIYSLALDSFIHFPDSSFLLIATVSFMVFPQEHYKAYLDFDTR